MKDDEIRFFHEFVVETDKQGATETKAVLELENGQVRVVTLDKFSFIT
jgi:hypothetical protein